MSHFSADVLERSFDDAELQRSVWAEQGPEARREALMRLAGHRDRHGDHWQLVWVDDIRAECGEACWVFYDPFDGGSRDAGFGSRVIG